jgi:hypothetical protein
MKLPEQCFPPRLSKLTPAELRGPASALPADLESAVRCCTMCHHAAAAGDGVSAKADRPHGAQVALSAVQNCTACHRS